MNVFIFLYFIVFPHYLVHPYEGLNAGWQVGQLAAPLSSLVELPVFVPSPTARLTRPVDVGKKPYRLSLPSLSFIEGRHGRAAPSSGRHSKGVAIPDPLQQLLTLIGPPPDYPLPDATPPRLLFDCPPRRLLSDAPPDRLLIAPPPPKGWFESASYRASIFVQDSLGSLVEHFSSASTSVARLSTTIASRGLACYMAGVFSALVGQRAFFFVKGSQVSWQTHLPQTSETQQCVGDLKAISEHLVNGYAAGKWRSHGNRLRRKLKLSKDLPDLLLSSLTWGHTEFRCEDVPLRVKALADAFRENRLRVLGNLRVCVQKHSMPFISLSAIPTKQRSDDALLDSIDRSPERGSFSFLWNCILTF